MPKLSEVLGGIVDDIAQAQLTGELKALELLAIYQENEVFRHLSPPRVRFRNINLTLRFAIGSMNSVGISSDAYATVARVWTDHLIASLLPALFVDLTDDPTVQRVLKPILDRALRQASTLAYDGKALLEGQFSTVLKTTENFVAEVIKSVPADVRRSLPPLAFVRKLTRRQATAALNRLKPRFRKVALAQSAQDFDLDVLIAKSELQGLPEYELQVLSFNLSIEDNPLETD